jgi:hypothetical protein
MRSSRRCGALLPSIGMIGTMIGLVTLAACDASPAARAASDTTRLTVHVVARDAKLIGSSVGGARVTVRDAASGEVLAEGVHEGGTGDTGLIMDARERNADVFTTPGAAVYSTALDLATPRMITVEAEGPLDFPQALTSASTTLLLVPGEDVAGDGVVLELWGYIVEILEAPEQAAAGSGIDVRARVRMLCSCPTAPGGLWEAPAVTARLIGPDGAVAAEEPLEYSGGDSTYEGSLGAPAAGEYRLEVRAVSAETGNAGRAETTLQVR